MLRAAGERWGKLVVIAWIKQHVFTTWKQKEHIMRVTLECLCGGLQCSQPLIAANRGFVKKVSERCLDR